MERHATFSKDGKHRLSLYRIWDKSKPLIMYIGINPSTADALKDDPTIRRLIRCTKEWGYGGFFICNLFTYISPNSYMLRQQEPESLIHPRADELMVKIRRACDGVIFMWGDSVFEEWVLRKHIIRDKFKKNARCFGITKKGNPRHPLYLPNGVLPIPYQIQHESTKD